MHKLPPPRVVMMYGALPDDELAEIELAEPTTVRGVLTTLGVRSDLTPIVVAIKETGLPVLRRDWDACVIEHGQTMQIIALPAAGDTFLSILKVVASLALFALAAWAGPALAPLVLQGLGIAATTGAIAAASSLISAGIVIGGRLLINWLFPPPKQPPGADPVYAVRAPNNQALPGQPCWHLYGRLGYAPPYAAIPWFSYQDNDQYAHFLLHASIGSVFIEQIRLGDTPIWNESGGVTDAFEGVEVEVLLPGQQPTLFPINIVTATEVQDILLEGPAKGDPEGNWSIEVIVNPSGTVIDKIAVDLVYTLFGRTSRGQLESMSLNIQAEYRSVDDTGTPTSSYISLFDRTVSNSTQTPQRRTELVDVAPARYQVRVRSNTYDPVDEEGEATILWAGLRGYVPGASLPDHSTHIAVKVKATDQISAVSSSQLFITGTRMLPILDSGVWSAETSTRSIVWAAAHLMREVFEIPDSLIDLEWLAAYDPIYTSRGDSFDAIFDRIWIKEEGLRAVLRVGRAQPVRIGRYLSFIRDEPKTARRALFTSRNMVAGSFWEKIILADDDTPDYVIKEFLNEEKNWRQDEVKCVSPNFSDDLPVREQSFGITNRSHAWREGTHDATANNLRRHVFGFRAEMEPRTLVRGDPVTVAHPLLPDGQIAALLQLNTNQLVLDRELMVPSPASTYVVIRTRAGLRWGPCAATFTSALTIELDASARATVEAEHGDLDHELSDLEEDELPAVVVYEESDDVFDGLLVNATPDGPRHFSLTLVVDNQDVYDADETETEPPADTPRQLPDPPRRPVMQGLRISVVNDALPLEVVGGFLPAAGATSYEVVISYDEGATTEPLYEGSSTRFRKVVLKTAFWVRGRAHGLEMGPWTDWIEFDSEELPDRNIDWTETHDHVMSQWASGWGQVRLLQERIDKIQMGVYESFQVSEQRVADLTLEVSERAANSTAHVSLQLSAFASELEAQASLVADLAATIEDFDAYALASAVDALEVRVTASEYEITSLATSITLLEAQIYDLDTYVLAAAVDAIEVRVTATETDIVALASAITSLEAQIYDLDVYALASALDALEVRVTTSEGEIVSLGSSITAIELSIGYLENDVYNAQSDISVQATLLDALTGRVTVAEGDIEANALAITTVSVSLDILSTTVDGVLTDISANAAAILALEASASYLYGEVAAQASAILAVEATVDGITGQGLIEFQAVAGTSGAAVSLQLAVRTSTSSSEWFAGILLEVDTTGSPDYARVIITAGEFIINADNTFILGGLFADHFREDAMFLDYNVEISVEPYAIFDSIPHTFASADYYWSWGAGTWHKGFGIYHALDYPYYDAGGLEISEMFGNTHIFMKAVLNSGISAPNTLRAVLLKTLPSRLVVTRIGQVTGLNILDLTSLSLQEGDLLIVCSAIEDETAPTEFASDAWSYLEGTVVEVDNGTASVAVRIGWGYIGEPSETVVTSTNASSMIGIAFRAPDNCRVRARNYAIGGGTSIDYPALSQMLTDGNSHVVAFGYHGSATNVETPPSGLTNRASHGSTSELAVHSDQKSSWSSQSVTVNASEGWISIVLEVAPNPDFMAHEYMPYDTPSLLSSWRFITDVYDDETAAFDLRLITLSEMSGTINLARTQLSMSVRLV